MPIGSGMPSYKNGTNVIISGSVNLTNPDESINFNDQSAVILNFVGWEDNMHLIGSFKIQIIGGPYDGRIAPSVNESQIEKKR